MKPLPSLAGLALVVVSGCAAPTRSLSPLDATPFLRADLPRPGSPPLRYYLAPSPDGPRPLLVVIQGSGCGPLFVSAHDGLNATAAQDILIQLAAGRFAVMVVEKPGVEPESTPASSDGTAADCSALFRAGHSLPNWSRAISSAIDDARTDPRVDGAAPVRLLGMSEGAVTAARLAHDRPDISHVVFISGFGCDQWHDMLVVARRAADAEHASAAPEQRAAAVHAAIERTEAGLRAVAADPDNPDRLFEGQTHLFWSTFGLACPASDLANADADVFVAYGTSDEQVDAGAVESIVSARLAAGRTVTTRRILGGTHVLNTPTTGPFENILAVFRDSLDWMSAPPP